MKKRVAILIYSLGAGGAERVVSILLNELKDEVDFTLVLMNDTIKYDIPESIPVVYLEKSRIDEPGLIKLAKLPFLGYRYKKLCQKHGITISLSFMNRPNYINVLSKLFGNPARVLINERAMPSRQYGYGDLQSWINRSLIRRLYPRADGIISNSLGNARDLRENFGVMQPVSTIYNPCDTEQIRTMMDEPVDFDFSRYTFITIGRLDTGKNHRMLIEAMAQLRDKTVQLIIIGEGPLESALKEQVRQLGLEREVFLVGHQKNPYRWLAKSDCFVFASNHEGFPNVILEALACGKPVISTDCESGPREILAPQSDAHERLKDGIEIAEFGILTAVKDVKAMRAAMDVMMKNNEQAKTYQTRAIMRVEAFDTIKQYHECLA